MKSSVIALLVMAFGMGANVAAQFEASAVSMVVLDSDRSISITDPSDEVSLNSIGEVYNINGVGNFYSVDNNTGEVMMMAAEEVSIVTVEFPIVEEDQEESLVTNVLGSIHNESPGSWSLVSNGLRFQSLENLRPPYSSDEASELVANPDDMQDEIIQTHVGLLEERQSLSQAEKADPGMLTVIGVAILAMIRLRKIWI